MGRKGNFPKKDKFDALPEGFKEAVEQSSTEEIRKRISDIAILDCTERAVLKEDPDVQQAKEQLKNLMDPYRENLKSYKLQIEYAKRVLDDKGGGNSIQPNPNSNAPKLVK